MLEWILRFLNIIIDLLRNSSLKIRIIIGSICESIKQVSHANCTSLFDSPLFSRNTLNRYKREKKCPDMLIIMLHSKRLKHSCGQLSI